MAGGETEREVGGGLELPCKAPEAMPSRDGDGGGNKGGMEWEVGVSV